MAIGKLGKLVKFQTSDKRILAYRDYTREINGRWTTHELIGKKPKAEFLGAGQGSVTFTIDLDARFGVKPWKTLHKLRKATARGSVYTLVIGRHRVGNRKWHITRMSEIHNVVLKEGEIFSAQAEITLEEC